MSHALVKRSPIRRASRAILPILATFGGILSFPPGCAAPAPEENAYARPDGRVFVDAHGVVRVRPEVVEAPSNPGFFGGSGGIGANVAGGGGEPVARGEAPIPLEPPASPSEITADPASPVAPTAESASAASAASAPVPERAPAPDAGPAPRRNAPENRPNEPAARPEASWAILLATESGAEHVARANRRAALLRQFAPELAGAWVHSDSDGSTVVYGGYSGPDDPRARADLAMIKNLAVGQRKPFQRSYLIPLRRSGADAGPTPALHLSNARRMHPDADPLYTLDVAVWFATEGLPWEEAKRQAEAYAKKLRAAGFQAWFYHDEARRYSDVTVGLFGRDAINPRSGLYSPDVAALMARFPKRLVNGEELLVRENPHDPRSPMKPQVPALVEVPK